MPAPGVVPTVTGIGGQSGVGDPIRDGAMRLEQAHLTPAISQDEAGTLAVEDQKRTGLKQRPMRKSVG